jgi:Zn-dependent metalloprotease
MPRIRLNRTLTLISFSILSLIVLVSGTLRAEERAGLDSIRLNPISQLQSASIQINKADTSVDPQAARTAKRLREQITTSRTVSKQLSSALTPAISEQKNSLAKLLERIGPDVKIRFRPIARTPRQIKGALLQRAARGFSPGRQQDEETARTFLRSNRSLFLINNPDRELRLYRYQRDRLGRRHIRFSQAYQDLAVWPAGLIVHLDEKGNVDMMDGAYVPTPRKIVTQPVLHADTAIERARVLVPAGQGAIASDPVLIIYAPGNRVPRLAWKMDLLVSVTSHWLIVIDALSGATLTAYNQVAHANVPGSGIDLFKDEQTLNVWKDGSTYYMLDASKPMYDNTSDPPKLDSTRGAIIVLDMGNRPIGETIGLDYVTSISATEGWLQDAVSAARCISETYDYYDDRHGRNSIDGEGGSILAAVRMDRNYGNAFWNTEQKMVFFGDAEPFAGALDLVGHELTHGVTSYTANLVYNSQSGALNESFSDIFGEMVEARTMGEPDWLVGTMLSEPVRNLKDPSSIIIGGGYGPYPSKMTEYIYTTEDNGGVHFNMTIVAHAFYLLAEGMDGAIGILDAERIFYRALDLHLVASSQFVDARLACIASAEELFGKGSTQARKTEDAFDAVEIFDAPPTPEPSPFAAVSGPDAALFVRYNAQTGTYFLGRREEALGDGHQGVLLSGREVAPSRASISGDGTFAVFVNSENDICFIDTDGSSEEECLGFPGKVHSVAMSPDGNLYGFVFLDAMGERTNSISVVDLQSNETWTFRLVAPATEGVTINTIRFADTMDFTAGGRYIVYDAFNVLRLTDGSEVGVWSIYAINLQTGQTLALVPPVAGLDIAYPALSQTSDNFITFDANNMETGKSTIYTGNLNTGALSKVATVAGYYGVPGYTGDDSAIVYSKTDASTSTGFSLWSQPITKDRMTRAGPPSLFLGNADSGVIYRRGTFVPPEQDSGDGNWGGHSDADGGGGGGCFIGTMAQSLPWAHLPVVGETTTQPHPTGIWQAMGHGVLEWWSIGVLEY